MMIEKVKDKSNNKTGLVDLATAVKNNWFSKQTTFASTTIQANTEVNDLIK